MSEHFDPEEARKFIEAKVSPIHRALALQALETSDPSSIDDIGLLMAGEKSETGFVVGTGAGAKQGRFWAAVLEEVFKFFCTNTATYRRDREKATGIFEHSVTIVATTLAAKFGLGIGFVTGLVTVAVISVFKIGRNAWCEMRKAQASLVA
jgi:hypothetical protein